MRQPQECIPFFSAPETLLVHVRIHIGGHVWVRGFLISTHSTRQIYWHKYTFGKAHHPYSDGPMAHGLWCWCSVLAMLVCRRRVWRRKQLFRTHCPHHCELCSVNRDIAKVHAKVQIAFNAVVTIATCVYLAVCVSMSLCVSVCVRVCNWRAAVLACVSVLAALSSMAFFLCNDSQDSYQTVLSFVELWMLRSARHYVVAISWVCVLCIKCAHVSQTDVHCVLRTCREVIWDACMLLVTTKLRFLSQPLWSLFLLCRSLCVVCDCNILPNLRSH